MMRGIAAAVVILVRLPWEVGREAWFAAGNVWVWAVMEWDARGRHRPRW